VVLNVNRPMSGDLYLRAGPREVIHFKPDEVKAAIVTCGGLCPGLNTVIREVVNMLHFFYGAHGDSNGPSRGNVFFRGRTQDHSLDLLRPQ
jgi:hypothetical protein